MRLLILGGTEFVGRAVAETALARGWEVAVFNRGRHEPPPGAVALRGDRAAPDGTGLSALRGGAWDAVVDTWSGAPSAVRDAARLLAGRAGRYAYVSSCSVYEWPRVAELREDKPVVEASSDDGDDVPYPRAKRGGELAAVGAFGPERTLLARAGLILGPWENVGRLPWWLNRIARGGPVLAPGPRDLPLQYVDVRDLAAWLLDGLGGGLAGPYDLASRPGHATMGGLLDACVRATGSDAELRWTPPDRILAAGVEPWTGLPVWVPPGEAHDAMHGIDVGKALASGLRCRPVEETVADTWAWLRGLGGEAPQRADRDPVGITPELEARVLGA
ncbi:reductase [Streptomyces sudanensis]|uniref:reductase n=1 Tax=Streptomyces sudanensis TaxID=436397 RepID=UPI0020CC7836|nr:reductase [Streptomyces sudanensis]MCP9959235.1 reductase [Streptomyces sudanensis]MCQ0000308.1 reductase [Streptomyces sudanensis]